MYTRSSPHGPRLHRLLLPREDAEPYSSKATPLRSRNERRTGQAPAVKSDLRISAPFGGSRVEREKDDECAVFDTDTVMLAS